MPQYYHRNVFSQSGELTILILTNENFPDDFDQHTYLDTVVFENIPIEYFPDALIKVGRREAIKTIEISYTDTMSNLYSLPPEIGNCPFINRLKISGLVGIPDQLKYCVNLEYFVSDLQYDELPAVFYELPNIKSIGITINNPLIPEQRLNYSWCEYASDHAFQCCGDVIFYTHKGNEILNTTMRKGYVPDLFENVYNQLLRGQVSVNGATETGNKLHLYRGVEDIYMKDLNVGDIIYDNGFSSFSSDINIALNFSKGKTAYIINVEYDDNALFFGDKRITYYFTEQEFLIGPQTSLLINSIDRIFMNMSQNTAVLIPVFKINVTPVHSQPLQPLIVDTNFTSRLYQFLTENKNVVINQNNISKYTTFSYSSSQIISRLKSLNVLRKDDKIYDILIAYVNGLLLPYTSNSNATFNDLTDYDFVDYDSDW